ncbi:MAG: hypothetical protein JWP97_4386 [Labilithrix sp.]|nr:hypothetical protein [Labilithrix sp.]
MKRPALGLLVSSLLVTALALTVSPPAAADGVVADRVAVRFVAPETGGAARPRFLTERQLGFFTRVEALSDGVPLEVDAYPERSLRTAVDRLVARAMLAALLVQSGTEPNDLPRLTTDARAELADRLGGNAVLDDALQREGIDEAELAAFLRDQVRALWYVDKTVQPILAVTEDSLREAFRSTVHPYRTMKYEDARLRFRRWLAATRLRAAELEFLQSARARITIASVLVPVPPPSGASGLRPNEAGR